MGSQYRYTSSGSKSRDTHGSEPSQQDLRDELRGSSKKRAKSSPSSRGEGLSGDSAGEETLDTGGAANLGSSGTPRHH